MGYSEPIMTGNYSGEKEANFTLVHRENYKLIYKKQNAGIT